MNPNASPEDICRTWLARAFATVTTAAGGLAVPTKNHANIAFKAFHAALSSTVLTLAPEHTDDDPTGSPTWVPVLDAQGNAVVVTVADGTAATPATEAGAPVMIRLRTGYLKKWVRCKASATASGVAVGILAEAYGALYVPEHVDRGIAAAAYGYKALV